MGETEPSAAKPTELDLRNYELIEALGKGGMGEVYRCCDPALSRDPAIKGTNDEFRNHPNVERRFLREARITGSLQHPGIIAVHNLGRLADGRILRRARRGDLAEAMTRLDQCEADEALKMLCRQCLSPEREGRPRNAGAVAERVMAYEAEIQERLRRTERKRAMVKGLGRGRRMGCL